MKYFSTFSGIGGFEIGIHSARSDAECVGYSEIDKWACKVYQEHFPTHHNHGDIRNIDWESIPDFDLLVGGFPCQKYSTAGYQEGDNLIFELIKAMEIKRPKLCVFENVKGFMSNKFKQHRCDIINRMQDLGYFVDCITLDVRDMGIPQHRERIIITASIGKPIYLLKNKKEHTDLQKLLENKPSDAYRMPFDTEQRTYYRDLREMGTPELIPCIFERSHGYNKAKYRYNYSPTLRAKFDGNTWVYDKIGLRRFTVRELCRLQGFPIDWFSSEIPKTIIFKLIGNSFNGVMSKMVFNSIKDII